jgi:hypothetical protein
MGSFAGIQFGSTDGQVKRWRIVDEVADLVEDELAGGGAVEGLELTARDPTRTSA